jgi:hypothetical protein
MKHAWYNALGKGGLRAIVNAKQSCTQHSDSIQHQVLLNLTNLVNAEKSEHAASTSSNCTTAAHHHHHHHHHQIPQSSNSINTINTTAAVSKTARFA